MNIGQQIINEIVKQNMVRIAHPDPEESHVMVWSLSADDQLHALIENSAQVQIPRRLADLYGRALELLGAPNGDDPMELIEWAEARSNASDQLPPK